VTAAPHWGLGRARPSRLGQGPGTSRTAADSPLGPVAPCAWLPHPLLWYSFPVLAAFQTSIVSVPLCPSVLSLPFSPNLATPSQALCWLGLSAPSAARLAVLGRPGGGFPWDPLSSCYQGRGSWLAGQAGGGAFLVSLERSVAPSG
jgi:hypothetical protein